MDKPEDDTGLSESPTFELGKNGSQPNPPVIPSAEAELSAYFEPETPHPTHDPASTFPSNLEIASSKDVSF